ncbi:uncharacterized protein ARMOST_11306 [Armillaria ostoyae]|uniref:Uncharacterized protein n=1 Tax=Armillaria ostoyae TaxID=47428 RepID=A0A284RGS9_ARMOS|nr:uncharacterized protein ARMOST_11306 [Armillaria ostoyae]
MTERNQDVTIDISRANTGFLASIENNFKDYDLLFTGV